MLSPRQRACLRDMGIDLWVRRDAAVATAHDVHDRGASTVAGDFGRSSDAAPAAPAGHGAVAGEPPVAAEQQSVEATSESVAAVGDPVDAVGDLVDAVTPAASNALDLDALRAAVSVCQACELHRGRTRTVFGTGDPKARLMIIGEAPGAEEDRQGEPFVGRAGQLLNAMLLAIGLRREQVYIANVVKCRPPGNRDPHAEEAAACEHFLARQVESIAPDLILSVGRVSAHHLLHTTEAVGRLRGRLHRYGPAGIPLIVTYHPAYLLRKPQEKAKAWDDLQAAHRQLADTGRAG